MTPTNRTQPHGQPARRIIGVTLIELLVAMTSSSILLMGLGSALLLSRHAIPTANDPAMATLAAARAMDRMATELETAIFIRELTSLTIAFAVADRDGDNLPERIRYAWSGKIGQPLKRQYNEGTPEILIDNIHAFCLSPDTQEVTESYPGVAAEDNTETLLHDFTSTTNTSQYAMTSTNWVGQFVQPILSSNAIAWRLTRVRLAVASNGGSNSTSIQIRTPDIFLRPTNNVLEQRVLNPSGLTSTPTMRDFSFSQIDRRAFGEALCCVLQCNSGIDGLSIANNSGTGELTTTNGGITWIHQINKALTCQFYGKLTRSFGTQYITSRYVVSMGIQLRGGTDDSPLVRTSVQMLNHPELVNGYWELKFDQDPTQLDVNGDGMYDWCVSDNKVFDPSSLIDNIWHVDSTSLTTTTNNDFTGITVVDLRMRSTSTSGKGTGCSFQALRSNGKGAPITATLQLQSDGTQTLRISQELTSLLSTLIVVKTGLSNELTDLHLVVDSAATSIAITVNDVQIGTYSLTPVSLSNTDNRMSLFANNGTGEFQYARVRVLPP